jgi:hypothetical protein
MINKQMNFAGNERRLKHEIDTAATMRLWLNPAKQAEYPLNAISSCRIRFTKEKSHGVVAEAIPVDGFFFSSGGILALKGSPIFS